MQETKLGWCMYRSKTHCIKTWDKEADSKRVSNGLICTDGCVIVALKAY